MRKLGLRIAPAPYASNEDLPVSIRRRLPFEAQEIFRETFNSARRTYAAREPDQREETAHRVAWSAIKRRYRKVGDEWLPLAQHRSR